jgi:DNA-binding transcriptional MerR regulator
MKNYPLAVFCTDPGIHFEYRIVARLVRVSEEFILQCEHEELVTAQTMLHGAKGLNPTDVSKLKHIRYLHQDMGLPLDAVDFVLRYRERVKTMERQLDEMAQQLKQQKLDHQAEVLELYRRMAQLVGEE